MDRCALVRCIHASILPPWYSRTRNAQASSSSRSRLKPHPRHRATPTTPHAPTGIPGIRGPRSGFGCSNGRSAYASVLATTNKVRRRTAVGAPILSWILYARDLHYYNIEHFASRKYSRRETVRLANSQNVKWPHAYKPSVGMWLLTVQCSSDFRPTPSLRSRGLHFPHDATSSTCCAIDHANS
jgi:hypothetical protein